MDNMLSKIKEMETLRAEISRMSEELVHALQKKIGSQSLNGVSVRNGSLICAEVRLSAVKREGNWSPETYLPEKQAKAVIDFLLRHKQEPLKLCEDIRKMLAEKRVLDSKRAPIYLNEETCRILRESELAALANDIGANQAPVM